MTYRQVRGARPPAWRDAAAGWRRLASRLAVRAEAVERVHVTLSAQWRGPAASAALAALERLASCLRAIRGPVLASDQALCEHASEVERIQARLAALVARPGSALVDVDPGVAALVALAGRSDERAGARLRAAAEELTAGRTDADLGAVSWPAAGASPAQVRRWWEGLRPGERAALLAGRPRDLGALDGVPVAVRDTANRAVLDGLLRGCPDAGRRRALSALAARLDNATPARAYLLALDPAGDGRAVVAIGDPDRAAHVVTFVSGAHTDLGDLPGLLARIDRLAVAANGAGGAAAVLWLGYDAPEGVSAAGTGAATHGARDLDRFQEGLRASADGPPAHHTVVGHSYGSLVVGIAARDHRLPVDDVVFLGSPGTGVDRAAELGLPPGHVWSSTARFDLIRVAALADRRPEWFDRDIGADRWHGADPGDPRFGGRSFASDPGSWRHPVAAHNAYLDAGSRSLAAVGAIARGDYGEVP